LAGRALTPVDTLGLRDFHGRASMICHRDLRTFAGAERFTMKLKLALIAGLALAGANAMACYTVYDGSNRVIYQSTEAPVDMSQPLHNALERRFPAGASMVFNQGAVCTPVSLAQVSRPAVGIIPANTIRMERSGKQMSPSSSSPLLTDRVTAERQHLPHTVVAGDIVMVPASAASRATIPSMTVIPADTALARASTGVDTRMMGAGPARNNTVITEMRDPPLTILQNGTNYVVQRN
jgi:hypothetical protein